MKLQCPQPPRITDSKDSESFRTDTYVHIAKPNVFERLIVVSVQWLFDVAFFLLYLISARTAHRVVGYFEEEAVISYTHYLAELDQGRSPNVPAPDIARHYWKLPEGATLRNVVLVVRADETHHRDVNHGFASELDGAPTTAAVSPYPEHAAELEPTLTRTAGPPT